MAANSWDSFAGLALARLALEFGEPEHSGGRLCWSFACVGGGRAELTLWQTGEPVAPRAEFRVIAPGRFDHEAEFRGILRDTAELDRLIGLIRGQCLPEQ